MADWKSALSALKGMSDENHNENENKEVPTKIVKNKRVGVVYSTNQDFEYNDDSVAPLTTLPKNQQQLRVNIERAGRNGKTVTIIKGFIGCEDDIKSLCKLLKQKCGVGGSVKDQEIIIQGDIRPKLIELLKKEGYTQTK